jgi:hypothetical protein
MSKCARHIGVHSILLIVALLSFQAKAEQYSYVESFSTMQHCDKTHTTAWWDTIAGEVKLQPFAPSLLGTCDTPGNATFVVTAGDYAYVTDYASGLQVINIADPTNPTIVGGCNASGHTFCVAIAGDYAYVAASDGGFQVMNISNPASPVHVATCSVSGSPIGVAVAGDYAYVAVEWVGLKVVDISDPENPFVAGTCATASGANKVAVSGDYAYVADPNSGLYVVDISDPTSPVIRGTFHPPSGHPAAVAVDGDYAYLADTEGGLIVVDVSDPALPVSVGTYSTPQFAWEVAIAGDYVYVADMVNGLYVVDVSDPANPVQAGLYHLTNSVWSVAVAGDRAYVTNATAGLRVLDIADPTNPTLLGTCDTPGTADFVAVSGDYAYTLDYGSGLQVIQISQRRYDTGGDTAQSTVITTPVALITSVRLTSVQTGSIEWSVSADGGANWQAVPADGTWHALTHAGTELLWKSVLGYVCGSPAPTCSNLEINWEGTVATMLQSYAVHKLESGIEISWTLSEAAREVGFLISRAAGPDRAYEELPELTVDRDGLSFTATDRDIEPGKTYRYRVEMVAGTERRILFDTEEVSTPYVASTLYQNYPNPFNPSTEIRYYVAERGHVVLDIYDVSGMRVRRLVDLEQAAGVYTAQWDGCTTSGTRASSGVYFSVLRIGSERLGCKKILLLR